MIRSFSSPETRDIFDGSDTRRARRTCPPLLWTTAQRKLDQLNQAAVLPDLQAPPGNRLEALAGGRRGQRSIRINRQYRVCFRWTDDGPTEVEIVDYHN